MTLLLRNLTGDLVEKRLWPIAAALLAAIVAVPLVLGGGRAAHNSSSSPAPGGSPAPAAKAPQVRLDTSAPASINSRSGKARNPFTSHSMPKTPAATTAAGTSVPAATAPASSTGSAASPAVQSPAPSSTAPSQSVAKTRPVTTVTKPADKPAAKTHKTAAAHATAAKYRVAWRWGVEGSQAGNHNVARLSALPSPQAPALIFLGLWKRPTGMAAMFLVEPGAQVEGDGRCAPGPAACHILKMRAHQTEFVTTGQVRYRLDMVHVERGHATPTAAKRLRLRESKAGRKALRAAIDASVPGVAEFVFDRKKGLLAPYVPGAKG